MAAAPGPDWCAAWTSEVDRALGGWLRDHVAGSPRAADAPAAPRPGGVAVVALGSYARRELCPSSDVDLLLLHDGWAQPDLEALVRQLCYPLWDAGLTVGHAVHTPREAVRAAGERPEGATALVDRRLVAGSAGLLDDLASRFLRWLGHSAGTVLGDLADLDRQRHHRAGASVGMLEPDLKDGAGGLRDLHSLRWASGCVLGRVGLDALVGARYLGAHDHQGLYTARDVLLAVRCALHLVEEGSPGNQLRLELQDEVAERLGLADAGELMRRAGLAMRAVSHVHGRTWPLLLEDARGGRRRRRPAPELLENDIVLRNGLVELQPGSSLHRDPSLGMRAVAAAAGRGVHLGRAATEALQPTGRLGWDARSRAALLATLHHGAAALPALQDADHLGLLSAYLPGWSRVRGCRQRNPYHRYDLDTHLLQSVAELGGVLQGAIDSRHAALWEELDEPEVVLLATFLHDIGKAETQQGEAAADHCVTGSVAAREWMLTMGFDQRRADRVAELVRLHLLLPDVATGRDLDDPDEIATVARRVRRPETLDGLYLLSLADGRATGPGAWSEWKEQLLRDLHARVRRILTRRDRIHDDAALQDTVVEDARRLLDGIAAADPHELVRGLPRRYLATARAEQVAAHARLVAGPPLVVGELRAALRDGPSTDTAVLSVVATDRRGLMADCAGVLAGHGFPVLEARAFTRADGLALDWFVVHGACSAAEVVIDDLVSAGAGNLDVAALVSRREARRGERRRGSAPPDAVTVSFERGPVLTRVEVSGPDSPGVLYRLARALAVADIDVVGARVATLGPQVRDVFFLRPMGGPVDTEALATRLRDAAAGDPRF